MIPKLCFYIWKTKRRFTFSKIESNVSKCHFRQLKIAYQRSPSIFKTEFEGGPGRGDTCHPFFLDEILLNWRHYPTTLNSKTKWNIFVIFPCIKFRYHSRLQDIITFIGKDWTLLYTGSFKSFEGTGAILDPRALLFCAWQTARRALVSHVIKDKGSGVENGTGANQELSPPTHVTQRLAQSNLLLQTGFITV